MDPIHVGTARVPCPACGAPIALDVFAVPSGATAGELTVDLSTDLGPARAHAETCVVPVDVPMPEPTPEVAPEAPASDQTGSAS